MTTYDSERERLTHLLTLAVEFGDKKLQESTAKKIVKLNKKNKRGPGFES